LAWYAVEARDLPWRKSRDPYGVWLSEMMLQQTQVETVRAYFDRFLRALPTIDALAKADEHEVLRLWEGLGYYRRARQLHRAARIIAEQHGGRFPQDPTAVRRLPGIGRYTAGAILSIAFDQRQPILEANTVRLLSRLLAYAGRPQSAEGQRILWATAERLLPRRDPGRFNQALMELGSRVCTPRGPQCAACPLATLCQANKQGLQNAIPRKTPKPAMEPVREAAVWVRRGGRVLILRWPEGRRWAGLWDFPRFALDAEHPAALRRELSARVFELTGAKIEPLGLAATLVHSVTRFRITLECYEARCLTSGGVSSSLETRWIRPGELKNYPLSSAGRKLANQLNGKAEGGGRRAET